MIDSILPLQQVCPDYETVKYIAHLKPNAQGLLEAPHKSAAA
jgi:hypothetical protein